MWNIICICKATASGERLSYEIAVSEEKLKEQYIPKLCIQLIVENAVVHGLEPKVDNGFVKVSV